MIKRKLSVTKSVTEALRTQFPKTADCIRGPAVTVGSTMREISAK